MMLIYRVTYIIEDFIVVKVCANIYCIELIWYNM